MILSTLVTSQLHFEMCAGVYGHPVLLRRWKTLISWLSVQSRYLRMMGMMIVSAR